MTYDQIFLSALGIVTAAYVFLKAHKTQVDGEVEKAREKSAGAKAIADIMTILTSQGNTLTGHGNQLDEHKKRIDHIENKYIETLQDAFNHYVKK